MGADQTDDQYPGDEGRHADETSFDDDARSGDGDADPEEHHRLLADRRWPERECRTEHDDERQHPELPVAERRAHTDEKQHGTNPGEGDEDRVGGDVGRAGEDVDHAGEVADRPRTGNRAPGVDQEVECPQRLGDACTLTVIDGSVDATHEPRHRRQHPSAEPSERDRHRFGAEHAPGRRSDELMDGDGDHRDDDEPGDGRLDAEDAEDTEGDGRTHDAQKAHCGHAGAEAPRLIDLDQLGRVVVDDHQPLRASFARPGDGSCLAGHPSPVVASPRLLPTSSNRTFSSSMVRTSPSIGSRISIGSGSSGSTRTPRSRQRVHSPRRSFDFSS